jgi:hypothetical protein
MRIFDFTYANYNKLLAMIKDQGYLIRNYHNYMNSEAVCILRHDIDFDVEKALRMAELEAAMGVKSTYFVLVNTNFYNVCSSNILKMLKEILALGHEIGLHYDEAQYIQYGVGGGGAIATNSRYLDGILKDIQKETHLLEQVIECPVTTVSMHRPSQFILDADIHIPNMVNSYGKEFFYHFKYLSDSRHNWREDVEAAVLAGEYKKLHILTHPFWYTKTKETCRDKLYEFITKANRQRYHEMSVNFKDIEEFIKYEEI